MNPRPIIALALWLAAGPGDASPEWTAHASRPGPDLPATGQSRFDEIYRQADGSYRIPYPFSALVSDLERRIDNGNESGVRRVLIPLGRSLQREAPAPHYFRFPREVIALEGEPALAQGTSGSVLEYRLFIAHQPTTETLEVISYNDDLGRFEFQLVDDYRADGNVRVEPANRVLCLSCHQNAGPIFARRPWSETPFNVAVASKLAQHYPPAAGSLVDLVSVDAGLIDVLSERANYLSAAQAVWRHGCTGPTCRAAALRAILQYRLSGNTGFDTSHAEFRRHYADQLRQNWHARWPGGLALAASRIEDRDPFEPASSLSQDPLALRPPHAVWHEADAVLAQGVLQRLAGFFSADDIARLDRRLQELGANGNDREYTVMCRARDEPMESVELECGDNARDSLQSRITFSLDTDSTNEVRVQTLRLPGDSILWQPKSTVARKIPSGIEVSLRHVDGELSQRLRNGVRLRSLRLTWEDDPAHSPVTLALATRDESTALDHAIRQILRANLEHRSDSLSDRPFRRDAILPELMQALGIGQPQRVSLERSLQKSRENEETAVLEDDLALLYPYCGSCHAKTGRHPPGFLAPDDTLAMVNSCAPRIWRRLAGWKALKSQLRAPMPPPATLTLSGTDPASWPASGHYRRLLQAVENLLEQQSATGDWRFLPYESLPVCSGTAETRRRVQPVVNPLNSGA